MSCSTEAAPPKMPERTSLPDLARIALGGLILRLHTDKPATLTEPHTADYKLFRRKGAAGNGGGEEISLRLDPDSMPSVHGMRPLLESGQSWSAFSDESKRRMIVLQSPGSASPNWQMLIERGSSEVIIYCGGRLVARVGGRTTIMNPVTYPLDLVLMMYLLAEREGVIVHSTGIALNGRGLLFPGVSGAGKSTLTRLFAGSGNAVRLSDDRIIARNIGGELRMFGTPWLGEAGVCADASAPLSAMLFLQKSATNCVRRLSGKETLERLLPVISVPWYDREMISPVLAICEALVARIPAYDFGFAPTSDAVAFLEALQR